MLTPEKDKLKFLQWLVFKGNNDYYNYEIFSQRMVYSLHSIVHGAISIDACLPSCDLNICSGKCSYIIIGLFNLHSLFAVFGTLVKITSNRCAILCGYLFYINLGSSKISSEEFYCRKFRRGKMYQIFPKRKLRTPQFSRL